MRTALQNLLEALYELLFPACCLGCKKQLGFCRPPLLCEDCQAGVSLISPPCCPCCGSPGAESLCPACLRHPFAFDRARSLLLYQDPVNSLVLRLKFGGDLTGLTTFTALAEQADAAALLREPDLILPVPLHIRRLRWRGFNQSLLIAKACFPAWKDKIQPDLLQRHRPTAPQTQLGGAERRSNLDGAFRLRDLQTARDKRILLVDDVFTTGSTLNECAKVLRAAGAAEIEAFTLARAVK